MAFQLVPYINYCSIMQYYIQAPGSWPWNWSPTYITGFKTVTGSTVLSGMANAFQYLNHFIIMGVYGVHDVFTGLYSFRYL